MPAPKKNVNDVKNTRKALNELLDKMTDHLKENPDVINILDLTTHFNITNKYFSNITAMIEGKPWQKEIKNKIDAIYDIVESRRLKKGENASNTAWHIFLLKAYHKKVEEQHIFTKNENKDEISGGLNININYPD